ncbi:MAG: beta-ketoacyl-ACP synthase III [Huintestinicola sp.]
MFGINIVATGSYTPATKVTNDDLSKIVETNDEWISTRTGIKERCLVNGEPTWYMGTMAAKQALERSGVDPSEIGLIIDATITNDFQTPSVACMIQGEIGASNAACFDVNAACSGFVYSLDAAKRFLQTDDDLKYVLVVANETLSKITNYSDRTTCILFGDGAAAVLVERSEKLYTAWTGADGTGAKFLYAKGLPDNHPFFTGENKSLCEDFTANTDHHFLVQDGKEVYKFATKALPTAAQKAAAKIGLDINDIDVFVPHQANYRIIETAAKNLGVSVEKFVITLDRHGNTSSASIPIALDEAVTSGRIKRGDKVCLVGFGAGLTLGSVIIEY